MIIKSQWFEQTLRMNEKQLFLQNDGLKTLTYGLLKNGIDFIRIEVQICYFQ
jgi:hypothetical protein